MTSLANSIASGMEDSAPAGTECRGNELPDRLDTLCDLIRIPSCSHAGGGDEAAVQGYVEKRMREFGARVTVLDATKVEGFLEHPLCCGPERDYRNRPTIIGEIGPAGAPALLILAHSDTVPYNNEPELWKVTDPFHPLIRDGRIYGRGAGDDKCGVTTVLHLIRHFASQPERMKRRLIFASTVDEENGVGNGLLLLHLAGLRAEAALYLDGTGKFGMIGNLGGSTLYLRPKRIMAQNDLSALADRLHAGCEELSASRSVLFDSHPTFVRNDSRESSVFMRAELNASEPFLVVLFYTLPGEERATVLGQLNAMIASSLGSDAELFAVTCRQPWFEPTSLEECDPWVESFSESFFRVTGRRPDVRAGAKQDSFILRKYSGIPTISFGVSRLRGPGAIHSPDEYITCEDLEFGWSVAKRVVADWLEGGNP